MTSTLPKHIQERFSIQKWKWYVVDVRDYRFPEIIIKHFDNKQQAQDFIDIHCGPNSGYWIVSWKEAKEFKIARQPEYDRSKKRDKISKHPKFKYPKDCKTQYQKQLFRNNERRRMKTDKERPKLNKNIAWEIIEDKPVLFTKRLKKWRNHHWAFSQPVPGIKRWKKEHELNFRRIVILSNIVRCLQAHYDVGPYLVDEVADMLYDIFSKKIEKHLKPEPIYGPRLQYVRAEFISRGFIHIFEANPSLEHNYVCSIHLEAIFVFPKWCWHKHEEIFYY